MYIYIYIYIYIYVCVCVHGSLFASSIFASLRLFIRQLPVHYSLAPGSLFASSQFTIC